MIIATFVIPHLSRDAKFGDDDTKKVCETDTQQDFKYSFVEVIFNVSCRYVTCTAAPKKIFSCCINCNYLILEVIILLEKEYINKNSMCTNIKLHLKGFVLRNQNL